MANKNPVNNQRADRAANRKRGNAPELSPGEQSILVAKEIRIKPKTKDFYDEVINNKKITQREAYLKTHKTTNVASADATASKLLSSPKYAIYSQRVVGKAKRRVAQLIDSRNENIGLKASQDVLDRTEGKAVSKQEITQRTVSVKLDLSGVRIGAHHIQLDPNTAE